jgi:hypothetical protein
VYSRQQTQRARRPSCRDVAERGVERAFVGHVGVGSDERAEPVDGFAAATELFEREADHGERFVAPSAS